MTGLRAFEVVTSTGVVLFRGLERYDGSIILKYRGDYDARHGNGRCQEAHASISEVFSIAPTSHVIRYSTRAPEQADYTPPKQGESPSVCEILNRGD